MDKNKKRRGAPPKGEAKRSRVVAIRLTKAEWREVAMEAAMAERPLADLARTALFELLRHKKAEREPNKSSKNGVQ